MAKRKSTIRKGQFTGRRSRKTIDLMLRELHESIDKQKEMNEAMRTANRPKGEHMVIEYQLRSVFDLMLQSDAEALQRFSGLVEVMLDDAPKQVRS